MWSLTIIVLIALTCIAQSSFIFHAWGDILTVTECGCTVLMGIHNLLRLIHLNRNRNSLKELITEFVENIWISKKQDESIAKKCEKDMVILKIVSILLFLLITMYVALPLFEIFSDLDSANKQFPYKMLFPYNAMSGIAFTITYILTSLAGFGVVSTLFAEDSLFGFFIAYTCGQLSLLHKRIDRLGYVGKRTASFTIYNYMTENSIVQLERNKNSSKLLEQCVQAEYHKLLRKVILHHNRIIGFHKHLETFFSPILLINFTISSFLICAVGLQIAAVKMSTGNLTKLVLYIFSAMFQLFILCWKGDRLIEMSSRTAWKLYACHWEGISEANNATKKKLRSLLKSKFLIHPKGNKIVYDILNCPGDSQFTKDLKFAIQRSQKPLRITAYKFSVLSLKSFTTILSTSLSYFTLLQTLVAENE